MKAQNLGQQRRSVGLILATLLGLWAGAPATADGPDAEASLRQLFRRPSTLPATPDKQLAPEKVALGAVLFSDQRLSGGGRHSCASCHQPELAFTDGRRQPRTLTGTRMKRNAPTLWNLAWSRLFFWDGRASSLEEQVRMPIEARDEMAGNWEVILNHLNADPATSARFVNAFPGQSVITDVLVVQALAAYVRSLVSPRTRFDAWIEGDVSALSPAELSGFRLFTGKAGCMLCHVGWRFTDDKFHDIGLPGKDPGRSAVPGGTPGRTAFKTPTLRELSSTAPYMHDGSMPSLEAVLRHYSGGFVRRPTLAPNMRRDLRLSPRERIDLIAFLLTLSSEKPGTSAARKAPSR